MRPFHTILVPLDGSDLAEQALPVAERLAAAVGAELVLARVHQSPTAQTIYADTMTGLVAPVHDTLPEETGYLEERAARARAAGLSVSTTMLEGEVGPALTRRARAVADLTVMTTHGRGPFSRFWLGSVADELLRSLGRPLLLIRPGMDAWAVATAPPYRRILVPHDGSERSGAALEPAIALGTPGTTEYLLLRVLEAPVPAAVASIPMAVEAEPTTVAEANAAEQLEAVAAGLRARGLDVRVCVEVAGSAAQGILDVAEREVPDLIAMATRGPGRLERLFLGSVADKIVRAAKQAVLVVPVK